MLWILILVYVFNGQVIMEKPAFESMVECQLKGQARITELQKHPSFHGGLFAKCVELPGQKG